MNEAKPIPTVSVLIAAWSAEATLARAIDSALAQTEAVEIIVVDDASTDATSSIAAARADADSRVVALRQPQNMGPSAARNRAIEASRAPWVTVLDADDFFCAPDRLTRLIDLAEAEGADFVADDLWKVAEDDPHGPRTAMISDEPIGRVVLDAATFVSGNLSSQRGGRREFGFLKPLMSRAFLQHHSIAYDNDIRLGEDYVLYAQALIAGARFVLTDAAGYAAEVRSGSLSSHHPTEAHARLVEADRILLASPKLDAPTRRALQAHMLEQRKKLAWRQLIDAKRLKDPVATLACLWAPPAVITDLLARLLGEVTARIGRQLHPR